MGLWMHEWVDGMDEINVCHWVVGWIEEWMDARLVDEWVATD